ncbi:hypothetical protein A374_13045 [Fictibacillus macauensis ZFHKF-1]|uniref:YokE-like PH domain-containing protein n=1 Tax=Fictibacillus macauensis ZFHKF-1 TaxID=1196324 RepID=I8AHS9_9BACL|nr:DUF3908 family protein [Fictibacillus macauensis]EIT84974.1 hypothetical protein A374_13045 [Fictibacillus macauensis ZFHKF-1]
MQVNTYVEFMKLVKTLSLHKPEDNYSFEKANRFISEFVQESEIKHIYVKNIFNQEKGTELFLFLEDKILIVMGTEQTTNVKMLKRKDIMEMDFEETHYGVTNAIIKFRFPDREIMFESLNDSNQHWNPKYISNIKDIFKFLNNSVYEERQLS